MFVHFNRSYADFALYYAKKWMDRGFSLYSDNAFPIGSFDPAVSDAYLRPDGRGQASAGIWEMRDYYKRMWKLKHLCQPNTRYPLLQSLHTTNGLLLPMVSFNDVNLDIEWMWNGGHDHFPADVILAETTGLQGGNVSAVHYLLVPWAEYGRAYDAREEKPEWIESLVRAEWGVRFIHELIRDRAYQSPLQNRPEEKLIREFGYGGPDVEVVNYWAPDEKPAKAPELSSSNDSVKWIGLWKESSGELLAVLINWSTAEQEARFTVDGKSPTGQDDQGGDVSLDALSLAPFEVKILRIGK